jgi:cobalt-zinc-cadmium efflux system protein
VHDFGDTIALGQAWYFEKLSVKKADTKYSYGFKRFSLLGAILSILLLLISSIFVLAQAIPRLINPESVHAEGMLLLAIIGVAVNGYAVLKLSKDEGINSKTVALHLLEDLLGWLAVLLISIIMLFVYIPILDPILAILITLYILRHVLIKIKEIVPIFLQAVPKEENLAEITLSLESLDNIHSLHHVHLWSLDGSQHVFSAHIMTDKQLDSRSYEELKLRIKAELESYSFEHSTIEIEFPDEVCRIKSIEPSEQIPIPQRQEENFNQG